MTVPTGVPTNPDDTSSVAGLVEAGRTTSATPSTALPAISGTLTPTTVTRSLALLCLFATLASAQGIGNLQANNGRDCAVCHLEWAGGFNRPNAVLLMEPPTKPAVADSETCLGCHDGSIADSRRQVWLEHGHKTGAKPSTGMTVPGQLPLDDGKLACRTCHTAHAAASSGTLRDAVFLRVKNDDGGLCKACHADKAQGPGSGTHPLAAMPAKLPQSLADAGAHAGPDNQQVVCQSCHSAHGAKADHLLLMAADSSQLCLTCHEAMRPAMWQPNAHEHPQNPPLRTDAQRQAIKDMGTKIGEDGALVCLSCHKVHHGQSGRAMLADTLSDSRLCIRCHQDRQKMANSAHNLRQTAPKELNAKGQTAEQSGPCGACHTFHSYARNRTPAKADPQGLCTTCHSEGQVAAKHSGQPLSHPVTVDQQHIPKDAKLTLYPAKDDPQKKSLACLTCHNPHEMDHPNFLRSSGDALCANCHDAKVKTMAGKHDFTKKKVQNAQGHTGQETGKCGFCHAVHNANGPAMWVATKTAPKSADDLCSECHRPGGLAGNHPAAKLSHPTGPNVHLPQRPAGLTLPLFSPDGLQRDDGHVACASCHDLHSGRQSKTMLRSTAGTSSLCVQCHAKEAVMAGGPHDAAKVTGKPWPSGKASTNDVCMGCHRAHSNDAQRGRWAINPQTGGNGKDGVCLSCHTGNAWATTDKPPAGTLVHPQTISPTSSVLALKPALPLASKDASANTLLCQTCHNPHAPAGTQALLRTEPHLPASTICNSCHTEPQFIETSMHSREFLDADHKQTRACSPCHATHAVPGTAKTLMWSAPTKPQGRTNAERLCLGCHSTAGGAKQPTMFQHPQTALKKLTEATTRPTELQAKLAAIDQITCSTCHIPHGRQLTAREAPDATARAHLSAIKPMLRPNVDREICATCHGIDSARVYLYFHNPTKRAAAQKLIGL